MNSFHLPMGEVTLTLEGVWNILRIPIHGELVVYEPAIGREALIQLLEVDEDELCIVDDDVT